MISRYTPAPFGELWSDRSKWRRVLDVELAVAEVLAEDGIIPVDAAARMRTNAAFDLDRIAEYESRTRHDVIAFLQSVGESLGQDKRWLHFGLTSYDVVDTALSIALVRSAELITGRLNSLVSALEEQAKRHKNTIMSGRTHGVHAEITTFGWKICGWVAEGRRNVQRLNRAAENIRIGKISGAVGTYPTITPDQENRICERLGLQPDPVSTQVIARDRHAEFLGSLSLIGGLIERIALEVRLLQHSEVEELQEPFNEGQRGSSAMPHKRNPVTTENLCGLARMLRSYTLSSFENMPLWHERDISHSSVERIIFPDATSLIYYMLDKCCWVVSNWRVDVAAMREHVVADRGLMSSGALLTALKQAGIDDDDVYRRVQQHAFAARRGGSSLFERVINDDAIREVIGEQLGTIFHEEAILERTDIPFQRLKL